MHGRETHPLGEPSWPRTTHTYGTDGVAAVAVVVATTSAGRVEETITNTRAGTVKVRQRAKLSPEIGGMVVAIPFREGERVRRGDVVLRLDDQLQRDELDLRRKELDASTSERERACLAAERTQRNLERVERLTDEEISSRDVLDQVETEVAAGLEVTAAGITAGNDALAELDFRRIGLAVSVTIILVLIAGLLLKIREIDRSGSNAPTT